MARARLSRRNGHLRGSLTALLNVTTGQLTLGDRTVLLLMAPLGAGSRVWFCLCGNTLRLRIEDCEHGPFPLGVPRRLPDCPAFLNLAPQHCFELL